MHSRHVRILPVDLRQLLFGAIDLIDEGNVKPLESELFLKFLEISIVRSNRARLFSIASPTYILL